MIRHAGHATGEELDKVRASMQRPGMLRSVALAPFSLVRGTVGALGRTASKAPGDNLADQWLDFLIQQAEAEDASGAASGEQAKSKTAAGQQPAQAESAAPQLQLPAWQREELPGPPLPRTPRSPSFATQ